MIYIITELAYLIIAGAVIWLAIAIFLYNQTTYKKSTGNNFFQAMFDLGLHGEYLTYKNLKLFEKRGAKFLFNCYLPREDEGTTEVDVLMIYRSGIYVLESKNYSGWIFGDEKRKTWTQTLPQGNKSRKEHFLNPIMQNKLHIKCLQEVMGEDAPVCHSIIVFSERCTLKKVQVYSPEIKVIKRDQLSSTVTQIDKQTQEQQLSDVQIQSLYQKLFEYSQVTQEQKDKHIEGIQKRLEK